MNRYIFIFLCSIFLFHNAYSQNIPKSFNYLKTFESNITPNFSIYVSYNENTSKLINHEITEKDFGFGAPLRIISTKINNKTQKYYTIEFEEGPSADPTFVVYENTNDSLILVQSFVGEHLIIPGNGNVYISGHANTMFNKKRKFKFKDNKFTEIEQPYYYVGLNTLTLKPLKLYSDLSQSNVTAYLPKDSEIEVVINKDDFYLLKTSFGLTGWVKIPLVLVDETPIKGLYLAGD